MASTVFTYFTSYNHVLKFCHSSHSQSLRILASITSSTSFRYGLRGLTLTLLPIEIQFVTITIYLLALVFFTWPYHINLFSSMYLITSDVISIRILISALIILFNLVIPQHLLHYSISTGCVLLFIINISASYVIMLLTMTLYILFFLNIFARLLTPDNEILLPYIILRFCIKLLFVSRYSIFPNFFLTQLPRTLVSLLCNISKM